MQISQRMNFGENWRSFRNRIREPDSLQEMQPPNACEQSSGVLPVGIKSLKPVIIHIRLGTVGGILLC